MKSGCILRT